MERVGHTLRIIFSILSIISLELRDNAQTLPIMEKILSKTHRFSFSFSSIPVPGCVQSMHAIYWCNCIRVHTPLWAVSATAGSRWVVRMLLRRMRMNAFVHIAAVIIVRVDYRYCRRCSGRCSCFASLPCLALSSSCLPLSWSAIPAVNWNRVNRYCQSIRSTYHTYLSLALATPLRGFWFLVYEGLR